MIPDRIWNGVDAVPIVNSAVVIEGALIQSVLHTSELPSDLRQVSLDGCTLIPGLLDAHVHYSPVMGPALLAGGVTTIRDVGNDLEWIIEQRALNRNDPALGPTILCCGQLQDGPKVYWPHMGTANTDPDTIRESVRRHAALGVDSIKLYSGLTPDLFAAGVDEGHRHGKFVTAHLGNTSTEEAASSGVDGIEHMLGCGVAWRDATDDEDDELINLLLRSNVTLDPTLVVWDRLGRIMDHSFLHDQRRRWVHPTHLRIWSNYSSRLAPPVDRLRKQAAMPHLKRFLKRAHQGGVIISLGTDTPFPHLIPGFSIHDELAMYVDAGITPVDALRSATSINARVLGIESTVGQIAPGMVADLVGVRGNPLDRIDEIGNIVTVVHAGHELDLAQMLNRVQASFDQEPSDPITLDLLAVAKHA